MGPTEWNVEERWDDFRDDDGQDILSGSNGGHHWNVHSLAGRINISNTSISLPTMEPTDMKKTDGTARTVMVKDINSGSGSSFPGSYAVGNTLYFRADDEPMKRTVEERWNGFRHGDNDISSGSYSIDASSDIHRQHTYFTADGTGNELGRAMERLQAR